MDGFLKRMDLARYIGDFVYGATDGIVTTFAVVAGVAGAELASSIVIILGFANLIADGISMAASNYLAVSSEEDYVSLNGELASQKKPMKSALITFTGFITAGIIPLLAYVFSFGNEFAWAVALSCIALFTVGSGRTIVTEKNWLRSGLEMLLIGSLAGAAAFIVGLLLKSLGV